LRHFNIFSFNFIIFTIEIVKFLLCSSWEFAYFNLNKLSYYFNIYLNFRSHCKFYCFHYCKFFIIFIFDSKYLIVSTFSFIKCLFYYTIINNFYLRNYLMIISLCKSNYLPVQHFLLNLNLVYCNR
jgi:hypothetical protein